MKSVKLVFPLQIVSLDTECIAYENEQKFYFVVAVNPYTWCIKVWMLSKETLEEIIQFIKDFIIYRHKCPAKIQTDGGRPYASDAIYQFCQSFSLQHTVTAAYYPKTIESQKGYSKKSCIRKLQVTSKQG